MIGARVPDALAVIDIDPRNGGSLKRLWEVTGPLPETLTGWSGRNDGGRHLYFLRPEGPLTGARLPDGIDLKTSSGYVIIPPSIHPATGQPYTWETHPIANMTPGLLRILKAPEQPVLIGPGRDKTGAGLIRAVREGEPGERHGVLVWAAFRALEGGILDKIEGDLFAASIASGHDSTDARRVIESVRRS
jgi:hypothetical protein